MTVLVDFKKIQDLFHIRITKAGKNSLSLLFCHLIQKLPCCWCERRLWKIAGKYIPSLQSVLKISAVAVAAAARTIADTFAGTSGNAT